MANTGSLCLLVDAVYDRNGIYLESKIRERVGNHSSLKNLELTVVGFREPPSWSGYTGSFVVYARIDNLFRSNARSLFPEGVPHYVKMWICDCCTDEEWEEVK